MFAPAAATIVLAALSALQTASGFPLPISGSSNQQVQFNRLLSKSLAPGCYYTCPPLTDAVPSDFGLDSLDSQGKASSTGTSTVCSYLSYAKSDYISCVYDDSTGALISALIDTVGSRSIYAGCAPLALSKNDRGRGTCVRAQPTKKNDDTVRVQSQIKARQWSASKMREKRRKDEEREMI